MDECGLEAPILRANISFGLFGLCFLLWTVGRMDGVQELRGDGAILV